MTEIKPDYINANTSTGVSAPASDDYWRKVAAQERKKAEDNLRLAADRAGEIAELQARLNDEKIRSARLEMALIELVHRVAVWGAKSAGQTLPTDLSDAVFQADLVLTDQKRR